MDKKIIKKIALLRQRGFNARKTKRLIRKYYGVIVPEKQIVSLTGDFTGPKKYTEYELKIILKLYSSFYDSNKVISYANKRFGLNITTTGMRALAYEYGVKKKIWNTYSSSSYISRSEESKILKLYESGLSSPEIAKMFNYKTAKSVTDKLKKYSKDIRTPKINGMTQKTYADFNMSSIDNKVKAYFLGLLLTDGYVSRDSIGIDLTDEYAISFLSDYINAKYLVLPPKNCKHKIKYRLMLYGNEYIDQFKRLGVVCRKSLTLQGPKLTEEERIFLPYILQGIIDGDGWIKKDGRSFFICSASKDFIYWCKLELEILGFKCLKVTFKENGYNGLYKIETHVKENLTLLKDIVYKDNIGMKRKYNRLFQIQEKPSETIIRTQ